MALDYYLIIQNHNNEIEPRQVIESLTSTFSLQQNPSSDLLKNTGISVSVFKEDDEYDIIENCSYKSLEDLQEKFWPQTPFKLDKGF